MCSIEGVLKTKKNADNIVKKMLSLMHHRGPDETGIHSIDSVLSIDYQYV